MTAIANVIGGRRTTPSGDERYRALNPSNLSDVVSDYAFSSAEEVEHAVQAARAAFPAWRDRGAIQRAEILAKAGALIVSRAAELGALMTREMGKPLPEAIGELGYAGKVLQFYAAEAQRPAGETLHSGRPNVHYYTLREPLGAVGLVTPWNFPFSIPCWKLGPALVTGNTVVWKPAPHHPLCSQAVMDALLEAGLPDGVVNLVHGGADVGAAIVRHPQLPAISFTGSTPVGQSIYREVSGRLARAQCEMGGKNALYVHSAADIDKAVLIATEGAFRSAGQKCTATSRVLVDRAVAEAFTDAFVTRARGLVVGDPMAPETFLGPVVDDRQFGKIRQHIQAGIAAGLHVAAGGAARPDDGGYFITPTVFADVAADAPLAQEEIFGPVVVLIPVDGLEQAITAVNGTGYGLSNTIMTHDLEAAHRFARGVESGVVGVNLPTAGVEMHAPFGGWKGSGLGLPEQGLKIIDFYTHWRSVAMQFA
ncbi:aldehyde dehydrogenase family protein [Acidisoma cladoniae]|uniref:aldehyde dehydrogenase family protein n=1 Tax=Acidisoma cladoniae TaxID=3040935 RepID=UPI00254B763E|nr:aldehyde dehydrogenase family protein [Acidisoma sp. PAMC 29798]